MSDTLPEYKKRTDELLQEINSNGVNRYHWKTSRGNTFPGVVLTSNNTESIVKKAYLDEKTNGETRLGMGIVMNYDRESHAFNRINDAYQRAGFKGKVLSGEKLFQLTKPMENVNEFSSEIADLERLV